MFFFFANLSLKITNLHPFPLFSFSIKWFFHKNLGFKFVFRDFVFILLRRLVVLSRYDGFLFVVFLQRLIMCERFRRLNIFDQTKTKTTNQIMVVNMLHNWSHMYSSHYSTIKCVGFELIHYANNLNII